jgi:acetyltransferase-like isoleucine patch superfamily enzyme
MRVEFSVGSQEKLRRLGIGLPLTHPVEMRAEFAVEAPMIVQGSIHTDLPFRMGAFSANYGGRLRNVSIGRYCSISGDFQTGWDDHPTDWATSSMLGYVADLHGWASALGHAEHRLVHRFASMKGLTTIGNDVWIGHGAFLRAGVTVGDGAVIGSRALVMHDVPPYAIVVGSPARVLRYRFNEDTIARMQRVAWWRYKFYDLPSELVNDPQRFLDHVEEAIGLGTLQVYEPGWYHQADIAALLAEGA